MALKTTFIYISFFHVLSASTFAQESANPILKVENSPIRIDSTTAIPAEARVVLQDTLTTNTDSITPFQKKDSLVYPPLHRDWRRLGYNSGMLVGATDVAFGALWLMPKSIAKWDREEIKEKGILWKWKENVKVGSVWDEDSWVLNWITHP